MRRRPRTKREVRGRRSEERQKMVKSRNRRGRQERRDRQKRWKKEKQLSLTHYHCVDYSKGSAVILTRQAYMHHVYHQLPLESTIDLQVQTHELVRIVDIHTPYRNTTHTRTHCTRPPLHTCTDIEENINFLAGGLVQGCIQDTQKRRIKQTHISTVLKPVPVFHH